jgi:starch-binding outer membrane protein SusE/F
LTVTTKQISDSLAVHGYADIGLQADLKWTVVASSGTWNQQSDYINTLSILRQVNFYLVGSPNGWNIDAPLKLVVDKKADRYGKVFYSYVKMNAGDEFKFAKEPGNWGSCYGNNGASGAGFATGYNVGGNFQIATSGVYRLTIDVTNAVAIAYVQQKQVGVVGNMQGWNAGAPIFGGYIKRDQFLIIAPSNGTDEFKLHDGLVWDNGTPDKARWWGDAGGGNLDIDGNGGNLVANTSPRTRVIWDGSNVQQVKYEKYPASEMRVVGDGINQAGVNDWDPPTSPQMTYSGNGIWTITVALKANKEFKFVAGNAWGAFDYEDNSGQIQTTGTPRPIQWTGGNNFKTPATAATYTITLNEYTQIVTVN